MEILIEAEAERLKVYDIIILFKNYLQLCISL